MNGVVFVVLYLTHFLDNPLSMLALDNPELDKPFIKGLTSVVFYLYMGQLKILQLKWERLKRGCNPPPSSTFLL